MPKPTIYLHANLIPGGYGANKSLGCGIMQPTIQGIRTMSGLWEFIILTSRTNNEHAFPVLWHAIVSSIKNSVMNTIPCIPERREDSFPSLSILSARDSVYV